MRPETNVGRVSISDLTPTMRTKDILTRLQGGDRRSIGRAAEVIKIVSRDPKLFPKLIAGLWNDDPLVRMRAADVTEKVTRDHPELLRSYKKELLGLMAESDEQEMRWHLAAMVPRLSLNEKQRQFVVSCLQRYLEDRSSIVKTFALQALFDLAQTDSSLESRVTDILREASRSGTAAMKARSRRLLSKLEDGGRC